MAPRFDTGFASTDAQSAFSRARWRRTRQRVANALGFRRREADLTLHFEDVVGTLGRSGQHSIGLQSICLDSIIGTVDRSKHFDQGFRPTSHVVRSRWEGIAKAQQHGHYLPPISVYRIGELHFVRDGHHRVSVARAHRGDYIDAYVMEVRTRVPLDSDEGVQRLRDSLRR